MADVHDVAAYFVTKLGAMSSMKLQKLCYYAQAWHLVWDEEPLFDARIEAWANGPVIWDLYDQHRGKFTVSEWPLGQPTRLTRPERETLDAIVEAYGHLSGRQLSHLTHSEDPWKQARTGLPNTARSNAEITPESLSNYYSAVDADETATDVDHIDWDSWGDR